MAKSGKLYGMELLQRLRNNYEIAKAKDKDAEDKRIAGLKPSVDEQYEMVMKELEISAEKGDYFVDISISETADQNKINELTQQKLEENGFTVERRCRRMHYKYNVFIVEIINWLPVYYWRVSVKV